MLKLPSLGAAEAATRSSWLRPGAVLVCALLMVTVACGGGDDSASDTAAPPAAETPAAPAVMTAVAELQARTDTENEFAGTVTFTQEEGAREVTLRVSLSGLEPGPHGFHIHETGDCSAEDFTSSGGHFAPAGNPHGAPDAAERHAGDFGNVTAGEDGTVSTTLTSTVITLDASAPNSAIGKAVVVHAGEDDLTSQPSGAAGARVGCGVVQATGA